MKSTPLLEISRLSSPKLDLHCQSCSTLELAHLPRRTLGVPEMPCRSLTRWRTTPGAKLGVTEFFFFSTLGLLLDLFCASVDGFDYKMCLFVVVEV
ncbi:hypothetical protein GQ607_013977 [Colletotrichum asianum]|uniref:Uncharacterized protein n=1 Tax=Colletotrichum asianum TaxID=702518 RepID=A0A8H3W3L9_9PEZI|nr:hypothetical protein GQ607_013977 [Colletotrichum asianum]